MRARGREDGGAAAVEFAVVLPIVMALVMALLSGGLVYSRQLSLASAARESARFGATFPTGKVSLANSWLDAVADQAVQAATGELGSTIGDRYICVAYVGYGSPQGTTADWTRRREQSGTAAATYTDGTIASSSSWCYDDGRGTTGERRVQVVVRRAADFQVYFFSKNLTLEARGAARFEAVSG